MLICLPFYLFCDLLHCRTSFYPSTRFLLAHKSGRPVLFQAPEFEDTTPGHILCTLVPHSCHPIPEDGRKKSVGLLRGVEAIGFAED